MYKLYKYSIWPSLTIRHYPLQLQKQIMPLFHSEPFTGSPAYLFIFILFLFFDWVACRILVPWPGVEPMPPAVEAWHPNHWAAREVPSSQFKIKAQSFVMAWRPPGSGSCLLCDLICHYCHHPFLLPPWLSCCSQNMPMCFCLRAFALAVLASLTYSSFPPLLSVFAQVSPPPGSLPWPLVWTEPSSFALSSSFPATTLSIAYITI